MDRFQNGEQYESSPSPPTPHPAVVLEYELNPVTNRKPVDEAGELTEQESPERTPFAFQRDQQGRQRQRRQPRQAVVIERRVRESKCQQRGREQRQGEVKQRLGWLLHSPGRPCRNFGPTAR